MLKNLYIIMVCGLYCCCDMIEVKSSLSKLGDSSDLLMAKYMEIVLEDHEFTNSKYYHNPLTIKKFYVRRNFNPVWISNDQLNNDALDLLQLISNPEYYGLFEYDYHMKEIIKNISGVMRSEQVSARHTHILNVELLLTDAWCLFAYHISKGQLTDNLKARKFVIDGHDSLYIIVLEKALAEHKVQENLGKLEPQMKPYFLLKNGILSFVKHYDISEASVDLPDFMEDSLKFNQWLKRHFIKVNILQEIKTLDDSLLVSAIKKYQNLHGLNPDGVVGSNTFEKLQLSGRERFLGIALSLERMRKSPIVDTNYVLVNLPSFFLKTYNTKQGSRAFKVIIGKSSHATPILSSSISKLTMNPYWYVPVSITQNEILPEILGDSTHLTKKKYQLLDKNNAVIDPKTINWGRLNKNEFYYTLRQDAGSHNALGTIKFYFSNSKQIYMHDTPAKKLFDKDARTFSHGCVRLQDPFEFVNYLFDNGNFEFNESSLKSTVGNKISYTIKLKQEIPLHIKYYTVEADENNDIYFYGDIYGWDLPLVKAFANP